MKIQIITTDDGSKTIHFTKWNESYHSKHGAIQEAQHVYIKSGLDFRHKQNKLSSLNILEFGFGTGLNALLSKIYASTNQIKINYHSIEKYPLNPRFVSEVNYAEILQINQSEFDILHKAEWEKQVEINDNFLLKKIKTDFKNFKSKIYYDIIFFDAFGPRVQPELWEKHVLQNCFEMMSKNAVWVTYSCKGNVRRDLRDLGFNVEKIEGPPGKREMLRAIKK